MKVGSVLRVALATCVLGADVAEAAPVAGLHVSLSPNRLSASTTIAFGFQITEPDRALPPALRQLEVRLPAGMSIDTSGLATCRPVRLAHGPGGCSRNSLVGTGSVSVEVPLGNVTRLERAVLTVFNGARQDGHTTLVFDAVGRLPIATQLVFRGLILPSPMGDTIKARIPRIPTLPEAPDAAIVAMSSTLGTRERTYYRTIGHRRARTVPKGATVPASCPVGGFLFSADFDFSDASRSSASSAVTCPL